MATLSQAHRDQLIEAAIAVQSNAYAPFSKFYVGAALLGNNKQIYSGVNVENSSYGLTICAERSAAVTAISDGVKSIEAVAIVSPGGAKPCGACRQFLYEFGPEMPILLIEGSTKQVTEQTTLDQLLPGGFRLE